MQSKVYAFKNISDVYRISSSGGASWSFAKTILSMYADNSCVYGTYFDKDMNLQFHVAYNVDDCERFRGSKYVFCSVGAITHEIGKVLNDGKYVLFIGTPCQVFSLQKYCEKCNISQEKLLTIDLICNGTPTDEFWKSYVCWLEKKYKGKLVNFRFRLNEDVTNPYQTQCIFSDGRIITDTNNTASYNQLFLKKYSIRRGCFNCKFKNIQRISDITIGDFWGIKELIPNFRADRGVSEVLINTLKGDNFFKEVVSRLANEIVVEEYEGQDFLIFQQNLIHHTAFPAHYDSFWRDYNRKGIDYVLRKYADAGKFGVFRYSVKKVARRIGIKNILTKVKK